MCLLLPSKAKIAGLRSFDEMGAEEFRKRPLFRCFDQKMKNIRGAHNLQARQMVD
jgi:hypothetical protein